MICGRFHKKKVKMCICHSKRKRKICKKDGITNNNKIFSLNKMHTSELSENIVYANKSFQL